MTIKEISDARKLITNKDVARRLQEIMIKKLRFRCLLQKILLQLL